MKNLTILLVPEMGKIVSTDTKQAVMNYLGLRNIKTEQNIPAIDVKHDLSHEDKCHIMNIVHEHSDCAAFFVYSENDKGTCEEYTDLNVSYSVNYEK